MYAEKKNQAFLNEFLAEYEGEKSTPNNQEVPTQETQQQSLMNLDFLNDPSLDFLVYSNSPLLNYLNDYFQ